MCGKTGWQPKKSSRRFSLNTIYPVKRKISRKKTDKRRIFCRDLGKRTPGKGSFEFLVLILRLCSGHSFELKSRQRGRRRNGDG